MRYFQSAWWWVRALFSRKLGVCPLCMRSAGLGTLLAWTLYAAASVAFPYPGVRTVLLIAAAAFTTLMSAHIVAYVTRALIRVRELGRSAERGGRRRGGGLGRREFLDVVLRASLYAIVFSLPGAARVFAQAFPPCDKEHGQSENPNAGIDGYGSDQAAAEKDYVLKAQQICDDFCASTQSHSACSPSAGSCVQAAQPVVSAPACHQDPYSIVHCTGRVKECTCECRRCDVDKPVPLPPGNMAEGYDPDEGIAEGKMKQDAADKCRKLCAKMKNCIAPDICQQYSYDLGKKKHYPHNGVFKYEAPILKCYCACPPP